MVNLLAEELKLNDLVKDKPYLFYALVWKSFIFSSSFFWTKLI